MTHDDDLKLDPEVLERLRNGTATPADELAKLKYWRAIARNYEDPARVAELDQEIADLESK